MKAHYMFLIDYYYLYLQIYRCRVIYISVYGSNGPHSILLLGKILFIYLFWGLFNDFFYLFKACMYVTPVYQ